MIGPDNDLGVGRVTGLISLMRKLGSREKKQRLMEGELAGDVVEPGRGTPKQDQNQDIPATSPPAQSSPWTFAGKIGMK